MELGTRLREARKGCGKSLHDIALATKISPTALEALENGQFSRLPGGIFGRAFVRSYAAEVGLDPEAVVRDFVERCPAAAPENPCDTTDAEPSGPARLRWIALVGGLALLVAGVALFWATHPG